jgi:GTP cyclohydrolase I
MTVNAHRVDARGIDRDAVERAAADLLRALGADVDAEALEETPRRVADAYAELLTPQAFRATTFPNDHGYDELIVARRSSAPRPSLRGSTASSATTPALARSSWH